MQEVIATVKKVQQILILPVFCVVFKSMSAEEPTRVLIKTNYKYAPCLCNTEATLFLCFGGFCTTNTEQQYHLYGMRMSHKGRLMLSFLVFSNFSNLYLSRKSRIEA